MFTCMCKSTPACTESEYSQLLQKFQFALNLSGSVSVVAESVDEDLRHKGGDSQASPACP